MVGKRVHKAVNELISSATSKRNPVIVSHGGVAVGSAVPNTSLAVTGALASGADWVKIDVSGSSDGVLFAFHDGFEEELLGVSGRNIQSMSADEIGELSYIWADRPGRRARVERLTDLLEEHGGTALVFALDRSWWRWPAMLRVLDGLDMASQILLKVPAWEPEALRRLSEHGVPYPVLAICGEPGGVDDALAYDDLNVVGAELIAHDSRSPWFNADVLAGVREKKLLTWVNSEKLTTGIPLFGGHDDELALTDGPEAAWGILLDLGIDAVQTEWPWLLRDYRARSRNR